MTNKQPIRATPTTIQIVSIREIGQTLKNLRKAAGMTQEDARKKVHMAVATLSKIENGINVDMSVLEEMEKLYGCRFHIAVTLDINAFNRLQQLPEFGE